MDATNPPHHRIAIAGTGFGGLGMAIRLKQSGIDDFVLLERAGDIGGVWRDNSYPGCACDVKSNLYSFSFAPNPSWSRAYSPAHEIHAYLKDCAARFGLLPHVRLNHEVKGARWDEALQRWHLETAGGAFTADIFISGVGALSEPSLPKLPGLERFQGKVMHSARWDHSHALEGKSVAVIGTGASAIQFVPAIQPKVSRLKLFQRTPAWVVPRRDRPTSALRRTLFRRVPFVMSAARAATYWLRELFVFGFRNPAIMSALHRIALWHMRRAVSDPRLRAKLTPNYTIGCKRILISDDYFPAVTQPNVDVITDGIAEVRERSIVTADGVEHPVDTIVFGTGFQVTDMPIAKHVRGRDGRTLDDQWRGSPTAYLGTTVTECPNFFMLQGPNTGLGHSSVITMLEAQFEHILKAVKFLDATGVAALEPRADVQAAFVAHVEDQLKGTVWNTGGCKSWYLDSTGRNSTIWPGFTFAYRRQLARFVPDRYLLHPRRTAASALPAPSEATPRRKSQKRAEELAHV